MSVSLDFMKIDSQAMLENNEKIWGQRKLQDGEQCKVIKTPDKKGSEETEDSETNKQSGENETVKEGSGEHLEKTRVHREPIFECDFKPVVAAALFRVIGIIDAVQAIEVNKIRLIEFLMNSKCISDRIPYEFLLKS